MSSPGVYQQRQGPGDGLLYDGFEQKEIRQESNQNHQYLEITFHPKNQLVQKIEQDFRKTFGSPIDHLKIIQINGLAQLPLIKLNIQI